MSRRQASIRSLILAAVTALFCCFSVQAQSRNVIKVFGESTINGDMVELGMIARINADQERAEKLRGIALGYSPGIGSSRELLRPQIELAIKAAGFDTAEFSLETPAKIVVRRASQNIPSVRIREAVEKAIQTRFNDPKVATQILSVDVPADLTVPVGAVDIRASIAAVRSLFEKFPVPVEVRIDGKIVKTFSAAAEVSVFAEVLVAANELAIDKKLVPGDATLQKIRLEKPLTSYLRDPSILRGVKMIKSVEAGKPLTADSFVATVVVRLGDTVRVEAYSGRIKIIAAGEANANGRIGDRIPVKNKQSGLVLQAEVVDEGVVRIKF